MLLAYLDEIGEPGAFIARDHPRFKTSPACGYAGFVLPEASARRFGQKFTHQRRPVFRNEIEKAENPGQWERKGASIFQFADWVAACVTRAIDDQLISDSRCAWVSAANAVGNVRGGFTQESTPHLWNRSLAGFHHSALFRRERPLSPEVDGQLLRSCLDKATFHKVHAAAERAARCETVISR